MDDGSTDDTFALLHNYSLKIKIFRQTNQGVARSRNFLCHQATGDMVAFLDSDDVWHPDYLKIQHEALSLHPNAAASFTGFLDSNQFNGNWNSTDSNSLSSVEVMNYIEFFKRYNSSPLQFPPSGCCVFKSILNQMGEVPFPLKHDSVEDFGFMNTLPLFAKPIVRNPLPLVMYRLSPGSLSADRIKVMSLTVHLCEILSQRYQADATPELLKSSHEVFPSTRRNFSKFLMGGNRYSEARAQIKASIKETGNLKSIAKSAGLLAVSYLPAALQPKWPKQLRHHNFQR